VTGNRTCRNCGTGIERAFVCEECFLIQLETYESPEEIMEQMAVIRDWGGRFVVPMPKVEVLD